MKETRWKGETITEPGIYTGIPIDDYHNRLDLLDGPSVSKSILTKIIPPMGSPKKFWAYWAHNPDRIEPEPNKAFDFGKAVHSLILGDEVFSDRFALELDKAPDGKAWNRNNNTVKAWLAEQADAGRTVISRKQLAQIERMANDLAAGPMVQAGALNGRVERSFFWKDSFTGIWLKWRPDVVPLDSGLYVDLKTAAQLDGDFLARQIFDCGYYLQGAIGRRVCRKLGIPFECFTLLFTLSKDYADHCALDLDPVDMDRGERAIDYALSAIWDGLQTGDWPGAENAVNQQNVIRMKSWAADQLDRELKSHGFGRKAA